MKRIEFIYLLTGFCTICSCTSKANSEIKEVITEVHNTVTEAITEIVEKDIKPEDIRLDKELQHVRCEYYIIASLKRNGIEVVEVGFVHAGKQVAKLRDCVRRNVHAIDLRARFAQH